MQWAGGGEPEGGVKSEGAQRGGPGSSTINGDDFPAARYVDSRFAMNVPPLLLRPLPPLANHPDVPRARELAEGASAPEEGSDEPPLGLEDPLAGAAPAPRGEERSRRVPAGARQEGGEGAYDSSSSGEDVEHYLFRFYDTHAEPGKSYVYRVKLLVEDPNYPRDPAMRPPTRTLSPDVIERLKRRPDKSVWWRESPYSEVSPVAHVPDTEKVLAGSVDPGKVARPPQRDFEIRQTEKSAKMMALVWDHEKALDVPGVVESLRGTVVNFTADTEAIDVTANGLRQLPGYRFETQNMVLDIRGGDWFTTKKNYASPGEVLLMDGDGKLVVRSELEDAEIFNNHIFPPPPEEGGGEGILLPEEEEGPRRGRRRSGGEEFDIIGGG